MGELRMSQELERFLDDHGKVKAWPARHAAQEQVYAYLAKKFEDHRDYTEHEVNALLAGWHTFGDLFLLRRGLVESGWLLRLSNGSRYWKNLDRTEERL
jgi:hypothetical protein